MIGHEKSHRLMGNKSKFSSFMSINNISGLKDPESQKDVNFFRKISKYDLDR